MLAAISLIQVLDWASLDSNAQCMALRRPAGNLRAETLAGARVIVDAVRQRGDEALREYTQKFDGLHLRRFKVPATALVAAADALDPQSRAAFAVAIDNIRRFHEASIPTSVAVDIQPGVRCETLLRPIEAVGLYVPAGLAPLPSTVFMLAVPAALAGCPVRILCTPPQADGNADPLVLAAAHLCGISEVFTIGGAQAIAAMAYGTATVPKVSKIFGPGNSWVTAAKQIVASDPEGAALDMPAGPSEVMVIADETAQPPFIAADLLAQLEHDPTSQAVALLTDEHLARQVLTHMSTQLPLLSRRDTLRQSTPETRLLVVDNLSTAAAIANRYAPEHLIIQCAEPRRLLEKINTAGSVFLGPWSPESMGDYCSGTNHVLPTFGYARSYSGLSCADFVRRMTVQELGAEGLKQLGPVARTLAQLEGLDAHAAAVMVRLRHLSGPES